MRINITWWVHFSVFHILPHSFSHWAITSTPFWESGDFGSKSISAFLLSLFPILENNSPISVLSIQGCLVGLRRRLMSAIRSLITLRRKALYFLIRASSQKQSISLIHVYLSLRGWGFPSRKFALWPNLQPAHLSTDIMLAAPLYRKWREVHNFRLQKGISYTVCPFRWRRNPHSQHRDVFSYIGVTFDEYIFPLAGSSYTCYFPLNDTYFWETKLRATRA